MPLIPLFIGSGSFEVQDATSASSADNVVITQTHVLSVQDSTSSSSADNVVITQTHVLIIQDATSASSADNVDFGEAPEEVSGQQAAGRPKRKRRKIIEQIEPVISEPQEVLKPKARNIEVKKYKMADIPKVMSEGWKPKEKYSKPLSSTDLEELRKQLPQETKKPGFDFEALERELTQALAEERKRRILQQNDLLMMLAMEEA